MLILSFAHLGDSILLSTRLYLIEQALCRAHYQKVNPALIAPDGSVAEYRCKADSLQADVAMVFGLFDIVTLLCGKGRGYHERGLYPLRWPSD